MKLKIKYQEGVPEIQKIKKGDWIDLCIATDVTLKKGESAIISLGVAMKIPKGYEAWIAPRSSTFKKYGLIQTNEPGIIDNTYCGNDDWWFWSVYATRNITIERGTRVCQFRLMKSMKKIKIEKVVSLSENNRGGCGSTGEK